MSEHLSLRMSLLDKQIVDSGRLPIGRVDDIELELPEGGGGPHIVALLTGAQALGERLDGTGGRWLARVAARLRGSDAGHGPARIDASVIEEIEPFVRLGVPLSELRHVAPLERWLARHLVEPIPGAGDARR